MIISQNSFEHFRSAFKGEVVTPTDPEYGVALTRWAHNAEKPAKVVAFVTDEEDVSLAIRFAVAEGLSLAIRGGGHNVSGASSTNGGLVIDLSKHLNGVRVDPDRKLGYVQGGALWETVDKTTIQYGLAAVAGTVNHTGVGGLALGGGYGWISGEHGLVVDNLVQATAVIADGSILTANNTVNTDLFWGLRGGGCNFGVCTEFVFRLHDQRRTVYGGLMTFPPSALVPLVEATQRWWENGPSAKEGMFHTLTRGEAPQLDPIILVNPFFNGPAAEGREIFKFLLDLKPSSDNTGDIPYEDLNATLNDWEMMKPGVNAYMRGVTQSGPNVALASATFKKMLDLSPPEGVYKLAVIFEYWVPSGLASVPSDAMAFSNRGTHQNVLGLCEWPDNTPESQEKGRELCHGLTNVVSSFQSDTEGSKDRAYGNYVGEHTPSRARRMFRSNYPRLQEIKKKYDPNMVFMSWMPVDPA